MNNQDEVANRSGQWQVLWYALAGAVAGYLLATPTGRRFCDATIQLLDNFSFECARFCQASTRAQIAAADGWKALEGTIGASSPHGSQ